MMNIPKAFISYSHDTQEHKKWVLELASRLRNNGIDAILDQFELRPGDDLPHFMETHLASSERILMICSEKYVQKANKGEGGVGYEKMIITSNLMKRIDENKIIPIIKQNTTKEVPTFLKSKLYIDFSKKDDFEFSYDDLVRAIHNTPLFKKPPVGNNPFTPLEKTDLDGDAILLNNVLSAIVNKQGLKKDVQLNHIRTELKISDGLLRVALTKLNILNHIKWPAFNLEWIEVTEKGIIYAYENKLLE